MASPIEADIDIRAHRQRRSDAAEGDARQWLGGPTVGPWSNQKRNGRSQGPARPRQIRSSGSDAHAEILDLQVVLDAVFRAFAADTGFLHAAERRHFGGDDTGVYADDAGLD